MVGIITFHRAINYGAVLQTYALQRALKHIGVASEVIDYRTSSIEAMYNPWSLRTVKSLQFYPGILKKKRFFKFLDQNINMSESCQSEEILASSESDYDLFITGSDQVWCKKCACDDPAFFLDFVKNPKKKKSYAASIGSAIMDNELADMYKGLLEDYDEISVREESAKTLLQDSVFTKNIHVHVDPTLLLDSEKWDKVRAKKVEKRPYILVYTVLGQYKLFNEAKKLSEKTGLPIIYLNDKVLKREKGLKYRMAVSPEQFVGYFAEAEYVLTNSFHGTAFSIIYKKQFKVEIEAVGRRNIRAEELLKKLGIQDRELNEEGVLTIDTAIDWESVGNKLLEERQLAYDYLKRICCK